MTAHFTYALGSLAALVGFACGLLNFNPWEYVL